PKGGMSHDEDGEAQAAPPPRADAARGLLLSAGEGPAEAMSGRRPTREGRQAASLGQRLRAGGRALVAELQALEPSAGVASAMRVPRVFIVAALLLATAVAAVELFF